MTQSDDRHTSGTLTLFCFTTLHRGAIALNLSPSYAICAGSLEWKIKAQLPDRPSVWKAAAIPPGRKETGSFFGARCFVLANFFFRP